jgi:hypothetical protein
MSISSPDAILGSIIEVGIAIAGFTGIVAALIGQRDLESTQKYYLSMVIVSSIASVAFAFLPMVLAVSSVPVSLAWTLSSAAFVVYFFVIGSYRRRQARVFGHDVLWGPRLLKIVFTCIWLAMMLQVVNVVLIRDAWPYLVMLVSYLMWSFSLFVALFWTLLEPADPD